MRSELGRPTDAEISLLTMARACGDAGGLRITEPSLRTLATRLAARGLAFLHITDDGAERAELTSMGATYLRGLEQTA
jgi:hypothetical protein